MNRTTPFIRLAFVACTLSLFYLTGCNKECIVEGNCNLEPDAGNCLAYIPKYYYDQEENKCKEFIWGGCGGTVPFDTYEECSKCECNN